MAKSRMNPAARPSDHHPADVRGSRWRWMRRFDRAAMAPIRPTRRESAPRLGGCQRGGLRPSGEVIDIVLLRSQDRPQKHR